MGDAPEVVREVSVNDFRMAAEHERFHLDSCKGWPKTAGQGAVQTNLPRGEYRFDLTLNERALTAACEYLLARYCGMRP
jgi:hypothetical protein